MFLCLTERCRGVALPDWIYFCKPVEQVWQFGNAVKCQNLQYCASRAACIYYAMHIASNRIVRRCETDKIIKLDD